MRHLLIFLLTATISTTLASGAGAAKGFDTKELWETYAPVFDTMSAFQLMNEKDAKK